MVLQSWKIFGFTRDYKNVDGRFDPGAARPKRDKLIRKKKVFLFLNELYALGSHKWTKPTTSDDFGLEFFSFSSSSR